MPEGSGDIASPVVALEIIATLVTNPEDAIAKQQAIAAALGALGIVDFELRIGLIGDASPIPAPEDAELESHLDMHIGTAMRQFTGARANRENVIIRAENPLTSRGIHTVRDILATGQATIADIPLVGTRSMTIIKETLLGLNSDLVWKDKPSITDVVGLYQNVLDVPGIVAGIELDEMTLQEAIMIPLESLAIRLSRTFRIRRGEPGFDEDYPGTSGDIMFYYGPDLKRAQSIRSQAKRFTEAFLTEQAKLRRSSGVADR